MKTIFDRLPVFCRPEFTRSRATGTLAVRSNKTGEVMYVTQDIQRVASTAKMYRHFGNTILHKRIHKPA